MGWAHVEWTDQGRMDIVVEPWAGPPAWRVECTSYAAYPLSRVVSGGVPSAWYMIDDWWEWLSGVTSDRAPRPLHPLKAADVERALVRGVPDSEEWSSFWVQRLGRALIDAPFSPLYPGRWTLVWGHSSHASAEHFGRFFTREAFDHDVISTRPMPDPESGRVRFWRKHARAATMPPVVVAELNNLGQVLVDGHARVVAANAEGVRVPWVILRRLEWRELDVEHAEHVTRALERAHAHQTDGGRALSSSTIQRINDALVQSHALGWMHARSRAWPLIGGATAWTDGALAASVRLDDPELRDEALGALGWFRGQGYA